MRNFLLKRKIIYIILIVIGIITVTGTTYAIFTTTTTQERTNTIETLKCLELEFSNQKNIISLLNTYPMTDERGSKNMPYTFTLTNKCGTYVEYSIGLAINKDNTLEDKYVKTIFSLASDTGEPVLLTNRVEGKVYNNKKTYILRNDGLENNASKDYKLILWLDGAASDSEMKKNFSGNIIINTKPIKNEGQRTLTADLDGGNLLQESNEIYREGMKIKLPIPAKAGYHFDRWEVTSGDATIDENNHITIGQEDISIKAYYKKGVTLTVDLDEGSTTQSFKEIYIEDDIITLIEPTKMGYKFNGWKITSGNGTLDGNILTINTESVVIEATWKKQVTLTVDLNGGSTTQSFDESYSEQDEITLTAPTKSDSVFAGWEITSGDALINNNKLTFKTSDVIIKAIWQQTWNFDFTGSEQTFTLPHTGTYKLEIWGAQGGNGKTDMAYNQKGGYGGYSVGTTNLLANDKLYIVVGGQGQRGVGDGVSRVIVSGGYNGGANNLAGKAYTTDNYFGSGGGATHIATENKGDGTLSNYENYQSRLLMVAGGGGGAYYFSLSGYKHRSAGGSGGGFEGQDVQDYNSSVSNAYKATGGKQTISSGNSSLYYGKFGLATAPTDGNVGGGGGGYYGGASGFGGGGGSGYIGNELLINKVMYCYNCTESSNESTKTISTTCTNETPTENCSKQGNGYAKITFISTN